MKIVRILLLTFLLTTGLLMPGCDGFMTCKCSKSLPFFDIQGVKLMNYTTGGPMAPNQKVPWHSYTLSVRYDVTFFSWRKTAPSPAAALLHSAYACDCIVDGDAGSKEKLNEFWVITKNDFDAQHLANDTINDLLEVRTYPKNESLATYLASETPTIRAMLYDLALTKKPELNPELQLEVRVKLTNGEQYEAINEPVVME